MGKLADRSTAQSDAATWIGTLPASQRAQLLLLYGPTNTWAIHTVRSVMRQYTGR